MSGSSDDDTFFAGPDNDTMHGGADLGAFAIRDTYLTVVGGDSVFDFGNGNTLTLQGYTSNVSTALIEDF